MIPWILNDITPRARILLIGRQDPQVASLLAGMPMITLGSDGTTQSDLEAFARHVVRSYMGSDDPEEALVVQDLIRRSENMFQYIFLVQNLTLDPDLYNRERRFQFLNNTPTGIFGMYEYYLAVQIQQFVDREPELKRVLEILLQLLTFSPSPVTPLIFLQALQSCPSIGGLKLNPESDKLAIDLARNAAGILFDVRLTTTGVQHLVPVHRTLSEFFHVSGGHQKYNIDGISAATQEALVSLHKAVGETGPESLLELCCNGLRHQDFYKFLHQYQYAADFCRKNIDDTSSRGLRPDRRYLSRQQIDRERLQEQLCRDPAFSFQDSLGVDSDWMERQWNFLKDDREWLETRFADMEDYKDEETLPPLLRDEISRWRNFVSPGMKEQLEFGQKALSELKTRDWSGYAFR